MNKHSLTTNTSINKCVYFEFRIIKVANYTKSTERRKNEKNRYIAREQYRHCSGGDQQPSIQLLNKIKYPRCIFHYTT